jgi:hypothetical protein
VPSLGLIDLQLSAPESRNSRIRKGQRAEKGGLIPVPGCEQRASQVIYSPQ